jgi:hypothetical protein
MVSNKFSKVGQLRTKISSILELWIIIYELITNYPRLIIKPELIIKQTSFYNFLSEIKIEFKLYNWKHTFIELGQASLNFQGSKQIWIWIDLNKSDEKIINSTVQPGCFYSGSAQPVQRRPSPARPFDLRLKETGDSPILRQHGLAGRFWSTDGERSSEVVPWS